MREKANPYSEYDYVGDERIEVVRGECADMTGRITSVYSGVQGRFASARVQLDDPEGRLPAHERAKMLGPDMIRPGVKENRVQHAIDLIDAGIDLLEKEGIGVEVNTTTPEPGEEVR